MMPFESSFERDYQALRLKGAPGWGDEKFADRMLDWKRLLAQFFEHSLTHQSFLSSLELGCGSGDISLMLSQRQLQVAGIDVSETAIQWAKEKFQHLNQEGDFRVGSVTQLPWNNESFDVVVDGNCLHCILGPDRKLVFQEVKRVLKSQGVFLVSAMVGEPQGDALLEFNPVTRCLWKNGSPHRYMPTVEALKNEISDAGFIIHHWNLKENPWWNHFVAYATKI